MSKLKIIHFLDSPMLKDALGDHPMVDEAISKRGQPLKDTDKFDLLIIPAWGGLEPGKKGFDPNRLECVLIAYIEDNNLWDKTVVWDVRADWSLWPWGLERVPVYFKKAWREPTFPPKVHLLTWPVLDIHVQIPTDLYQRDIDVGYYFRPLADTKNITGTRGAICKHIKQFNWGPDALIELCYTLGQIYHATNFWYAPPMIGEQFNWWTVYMHYLRRTKILFTSTGYPGFFGGDRRTAEAISSGALVFADKTLIQMPHPFEHGKHLFFFDSTQDEEIIKALELAKSYLTKEKKEERESIAKAGLDHAMTYHRSRNYVDYMMEIILREMNYA